MQKNESLWQQQVEELKVVVKSEVFANQGDFALKLKLIDAVQRLGVAYHFEVEIEEALEQVHATYRDQHHFNGDGDLYTVALCFRLLRQHGFEISSGTYITYFLTLLYIACIYASVRSSILMLFHAWFPFLTQLLSRYIQQVQRCKW